MVLKLRDELKIVTATPPKLTLSSFPSHKPLPLTPGPGATTPPLQPMVSVPFEWEEVPGRARHITVSGPYKPKSFRCLELPPRLSTSPTTVLDGPKVGRTLSHRFLMEDVTNASPNSLMDSYEMGLIDGPNSPRKSEIDKEGLSFFGPWRWASCNGTKWDEAHGEKPIVEFTSWDKSKSAKSERDVEVKMSRFRTRTRGSLYKLSYKSSRFIENIYQGIKQMVLRRSKEGK